MKAAFLVPLLMSASMFCGAAHAQPQPPRSDLTAMNDEFGGNALDPKWTIFHDRYGWANMMKTMDVGQTVEGAFHMQPYDSAWVRDRVASFVFQTVEGDFDVRARVRVRGANGPVPGGTWSLGGILARFPNNQDAKNWTPHRENWHFITTGVGLERGVTVTETKGTYNSFSSLKLRPFDAGWMEMRMVRVGMMLFVLARPEGGRWMLRDRFYRMDLNPFMQVGLVAYTTSDDQQPRPENANVSNRTVDKNLRVDMLMDVDWIRFSRPKPEVRWDWSDQVRTHPLADPNMPETEILAALGD
jgi:hypothetical protein